MPYDQTNPDYRVSHYDGQLFNCFACGANHVWFRNMEWFHRVNSTLYPAGVTDPPAFSNYFSALPYCNYTITTACIPDPADTRTPDHLVIDRIYSPAANENPSYPFAREMGCYYPGGNYWAIIGTYCKTDFAMPAIWPQLEPIVSGASILIPFSYFKYNQFDASAVGMQTAVGYAGTSTDTHNISLTSTLDIHTQLGLSWQAGDLIDLSAAKSNFDIWTREGGWRQIGTVVSYVSGTGAMRINVTHTSGGPDALFSNWVLQRPATVTFSGANINTYTGSVVAWLDSTGVVIQYEPASGVTASCVPTTYCHTQTHAAPVGRTTTPSTAMFYFMGSFSGGTFFDNHYNVPVFGPTFFVPWRPMAFYFNSGSHGGMENNYVEGMGQTFYNDAQGPTTDIRFAHNFLYFPRAKMQYSTTWNGYGYTFRQPIESKELNRSVYEGNIVDGSAAYANNGNAMYLAGSFVNINAGGVTDISVRKNIFRHISAGLQCNASGTTPPDSTYGIRYDISNNMFLDLDKNHYNNTPYYFAAASGPFNTQNCGDLNIVNNTVGLTHGNGPSLLVLGVSTGGFRGDESNVLGDGLRIRNNLVFLSYDSTYTPILSSGGVIFPNFPANPLIPPSHVDTPWLDYMNGNYVHHAASIVPDWNMGLNMFIGGQSTSDGGVTWTDISQATVNTMSGGWPVSTDKFVAGASMAVRMANAGFTLSPSNLTSGNPFLYRTISTTDNTGYVGANVDDVVAATGMVTGISITPGATSIAFQYTAPDSRACSVDTSGNSGSTWTRFTDSGGSRIRLLAATGLTASTAYQYRLMCYYDQKASYEFQADQITSGTISTIASGLRSLQAGYGTLPSPATQVLLTLTPLSGSATTLVCTNSPCQIGPITTGVYTRTIQPQTAGGVSVGEPTISQIKVQ
jgi:hypothetical protein